MKTIVINIFEWALSLFKIERGLNNAMSQSKMKREREWQREGRKNEWKTTTSHLMADIFMSKFILVLDHGWKHRNQIAPNKIEKRETKRART